MVAHGVELRGLMGRLAVACLVATACKENVLTIPGNAPPGIQLSDSAVHLAALRGATAVQAVTVSVMNAGSAPALGLVALVSYQSQPTGWLSATLAGTTAPTVLTINATVDTLPVSNYAATVVVYSTDPTIGSHSVSVSVIVSPSGVASIQVTSPVDTLLTAGTTVRFAAQTLDAQGHALPGFTFKWSTSNAALATVDTSGSVSAVANGTVAINADAGGVRGSLRFVVVTGANLPLIARISNDSLTTTFVRGLTSAEQAKVKAAVSLCASGSATGNLVAIKSCIAGVRAEMAIAQDPTDRVLLASLSLMIDQVERSFQP
jgi:hypothetical protein